jgi:hypothetical protein
MEGLPRSPLHPQPALLSYTEGTLPMLLTPAGATPAVLDRLTRDGELHSPHRI